MKPADMILAPAQHCRLLRPITDHVGRIRFDERPIILRHVRSLDKSMYLVQFTDGATTLLFPDEVAFDNASFTASSLDNASFPEGAEEPAGYFQNVLH